MRLRAPLAAAYTATQIFAMGNRLEVHGVNAGTNAAQVIDIKSLLKRAIGSLKGDSMSVGSATIPADDSVSIPDARTGPQPAPAI